MEEAFISLIGLIVGIGAWVTAKSRALIGDLPIWAVTAVVGALLAGLIVAPLLRLLGHLGREPLVAGASLSTLLVAAIGAAAAVLFAQKASRR